MDYTVEELDDIQIPEEEEEFEDVTPQDAPEQDPKDHKFKKGHKKMGGQIAGKRKEFSMAIKNNLLEMIKKEMPHLQRTVAQLRDEDPKAYASIMSNLMKYAAPTLQSVAMDVTEETQDSIVSKLSHLMGKD